MITAELDSQLRALEARNAATASELRLARDREKALREQVAELERERDAWANATYSATPDDLSDSVADSVVESVELRARVRAAEEDNERLRACLERARTMLVDKYGHNKTRFPVPDIDEALVSAEPPKGEPAPAQAPRVPRCTKERPCSGVHLGEGPTGEHVWCPHAEAAPQAEEPTPDRRVATINSDDSDVASVAAALADARYAGGLSKRYYLAADGALERLAARLVAAQPPSPPRDERLQDGWSIEERGNARYLHSPGQADAVAWVADGELVVYIWQSLPTAVLRALLGMPPAIDEAAVRASEREAIAAYCRVRATSKLVNRDKAAESGRDTVVLCRESDAETLFDLANCIESGAYRQPAQGTEEV